MEASSKLAEAKATLADRLTLFELKDKLNSAEGLLKKAEEQYSIMDYVSALQYAKTAAEKSREAVTNARNQLLAQPVFIILGILTGIIIGYRGVPYLRKRRTKSTSRRVEVDSLKWMKEP
jgi:hypothetical protein